MSGAAHQEGAAPLFDRRTRRWLLPAAGVTLALTLVAALLAQPPSPDVAGPTAFSRSALGYEALARSLEEAGLKVLISRWRSGQRAHSAAPLLLLEPDIGWLLELPELIEDAQTRDATVVVGLPKWRGDARGSWETQVDFADPQNVSTVAWALGIPELSEGGLEVLDAQPPLEWQASFPLPAPPTLLYPQLIVPGTPGIEPVLWSDQGALIGRTADGLYVVSDPDLWSTHGLARSGNAAVVSAFLADLGAEGAVFDEICHGFEQAPSIWRELISWPIWPVTAQLLALTALGLWGAWPRFGAPLLPPPRVPPGKGALIEHTAQLLDFGGHLAYTVKSYTKASIRDATRAVGLPYATPFSEQLERLDGISRARGLRQTPSDLWSAAEALPERRCPPRRASATARQVYTWREEVTRG